MKYLKLSLVALPVIALVSWFGFQYFGSNGDNLPPLNTQTVNYGDISSYVSAHGTLEPVEEVLVGSQVSGIIEELNADFNDEVERGQVVAQIDPSTFSADVSSAEAQLESAKAGLELARLHYQRVQELRERDFVAPSELDEAHSSLRQAEAEVEVRRQALNRARVELNQTTIHSPTDGIVISREVDVGQTVSANLDAPEIFLIATHLDRMHIYANVSEADIGDVNEGQQVRFHVDAYRDREFTGEVIQVRNAPIIEDNVVHYQAIISVENDEQLLKPGMTAEVEVITEEIQDALRVRNNALRARLPDHIRPPDPADADEGDAVVYIVRGDELVAQTVETGVSDGLNTEILSGLEDGDNLAVGLSLVMEEDRSGPGLLQGNQARY